MTYNFVRLVYYNLDQPPPPEKSILWDAKDFSTKLIFGKEETITHGESLMCIDISNNFIEQVVFAIVRLNDR